MQFRTLNAGNATHLNEIAARWRDAKVQDRTSVAGHRMPLHFLAVWHRQTRFP